MINRLAETVIDSGVSHTVKQLESGPDVSALEYCQMDILVLRGPETRAFFESVKQHLRFDLPDEGRRTTIHEGITVTRRGAGDWLIFTASKDKGLLVKGLTEALGVQKGAVVDISDRYCLIRHAGPGAWMRLVAVCHPSIDDEAFLSGGCIKAICAGIGVYIHSSGLEHVMIMAPSAYARHVRECLSKPHPVE